MDFKKIRLVLLYLLDVIKQRFKYIFADIVEIIYFFADKISNFTIKTKISPQFLKISILKNILVFNFELDNSPAI